MNKEINEIFKEWKQFLFWCYENNDKTTEIHRDNLERVMAYTRQLENIIKEKDKKIERLNKCIDEAFEIIIKDWNDKCTIPIHSVVDTGDDIRIKLYYQLFFKGVDKE